MSFLVFEEAVLWEVVRYAPWRANVYRGIKILVYSMRISVTVCHIEIV
jgi:hypothetical protein